MIHNTCRFAQTGHAFMKRALYLSTLGGPRVSPNPFVGAVIVAPEGNDCCIIGEGYHRQFGEGHAEVNAVGAVSEADRPLLTRSTMFVTLEPCSHFGKTPPCADLIIREKIPRVVVAAPDPFLKNHESGIERLRNAGIDVEVGLYEKEARWINRRFFTAHSLKRPFVLLKWAQSANGCIAASDGSPVGLSNPFTMMLMHKERAFYDAIMVGTNTILSDRPSLTCRHWPSRNPSSRPLRISFESSRLDDFQAVTGYAKDSFLLKGNEENLNDFLHRLYTDHSVTSLMVEGGRETLEYFFREGLFDEVRVEYSDRFIKDGIPAPDSSGALSKAGFFSLPPISYGNNTIVYFVKNY